MHGETMKYKFSEDQTIMKYAMRYGKKDNKRAEMLKIIHYAIITIHLQDNQDD